MITFESNIEYLPPVELKDAPLQIGDEIETWSGLLFEIKKVHDGRLFAYNESPDALTLSYRPDGFYWSSKISSRLNVRKVTRKITQP